MAFTVDKNLVVPDSMEFMHISSLDVLLKKFFDSDFEYLSQ